MSEQFELVEELVKDNRKVIIFENDSLWKITLYYNNVVIHNKLLLKDKKDKSVHEDILNLKEVEVLARYWINNEEEYFISEFTSDDGPRTGEIYVDSRGFFAHFYETKQYPLETKLQDIELELEDFVNGK